ncbi:MAG: aspartyl protease family protein [Thermodesulfobacteriota bacterium]
MVKELLTKHGDKGRTSRSCAPAHPSPRRYARIWLLVIVCQMAALLIISHSAAGAEGDLYKLYARGQECLKQGDNDGAIDAFSRALDLVNPEDTNYPKVLISRAHAYLEKNALQEAWKDVQEALKTAEYDGNLLVGALHVRGYIKLKKGNQQAAIDDFTQAIKTSHDDMLLRAKSFANRAIVLINAGRADQAISDLNKALELYPDYAFAYAARGMAHLKDDKVRKARLDSEKALTMNPDKRTAELAEKVLQMLSISFSGPDRVEVPMSDDGHVYVQVKFGKNGTPYRFMLDTGATHSVVRRELLERIQKESTVTVKEVGKGRVRIADGTMHPVTRYKVSNVFLFNFPLGEVDVGVFDRPLKNVPNLLGIRSLKDVSVSIDSAQRKAQVRHKGSL